MQLLYLTDCLTHRGGAPHHLLDIIHAAPGQRTVVAGRIDQSVVLPPDIRVEKIPSLASSGENTTGLPALSHLMEAADVIHVQNVMNAAIVRRAVQTGRAVITIQDHRVFCPGPGKTLPDAARCTIQMTDAHCSECLPDAGYRNQMLERTHGRLEALKGAKLVVLSNYMAQELARAGLPDAHVIAPPVSAAKTPSGAGHGLLLAGRLVHHKGIDWAYSAWKASNTDHPLRVAGAGSLSEGPTDCEPLGWLTRSDLRRQMATARALLFPSRWQEPFGITGVEALAEGTPVICMDTGGTTDWTDAGCIVVPPGDVNAMADAIAQLTGTPTHAEQLGQAGWEMVRTRFAPVHVLPPLWALYESVG